MQATTRLTEGRLPETFGWRSGVRRLRARPNVGCAPGRPWGSARWPLRAACEELADGGGGTKVPGETHNRLRKRGPRPVTVASSAWHRGGAPGGERPRVTGRVAPDKRELTWMRLPALHPPHCEGRTKEEGAPGADQTTRAAERWLRQAGGCLTIWDGLTRRGEAYLDPL
jgi:hypothetical protein